MGDRVRFSGLGDVYKRQVVVSAGGRTELTYDQRGTRGASVATVASTYDSNDRLERELAARGARTSCLSRVWVTKRRSSTKPRSRSDRRRRGARRVP